MNSSLYEKRRRFTEWWAERHSQFAIALFDVDGTLTGGHHPLPGVTRLLGGLRASNHPFCLLTNDGNHSREEKSALLARAGVEASPEEIVSCSLALNAFSKDNGFVGERFFVMGDLGEPNYAEGAGLVVERDVNRIEDCSGVIVGEGHYDWKTTISAVVNFLLRHPDRPFVVPNPDSCWPDGKNGLGIGAGGKARFVCGVLHDVGVRVNPVYLGKPHRAIFDYAIRTARERFNMSGDVKPESVIMFGDSLKSDILGANQAGFVSALMLTGITDLKQLEAADAEHRPRHVFDSFE